MITRAINSKAYLMEFFEVLVDIVSILIFPFYLLLVNLSLESLIPVLILWERQHCVITLSCTRLLCI